ncbi:MAG: hypothetical protein UY23_C0001G0410 [Candidatus Jorgensenbacteria bacterium GW2011_GWA1_48_11]|uniref:Uncharacterized protein n=1 Tax=Candidatus Jorgensenbacteria bacterium GW2011_GWA1_48_11 TaxID=1618660 RepID=A0A0G1UCG3_9BACT|nr:MAG: hypothetical protein UY23_C0001G0410 [Candidatus Jorgensenbacteria bacterium GW2011_GWA1_48_11]KKW12295.1 MAG: hypothetical protein UY51_C0005G0537 [Candidatus Jorgensenbacteria bacterium GW2011_GWB1_49_9]
MRWEIRLSGGPVLNHFRLEAGGPAGLPGAAAEKAELERKRLLALEVAEADGASRSVSVRDDLVAAAADREIPAVHEPFGVGEERGGDAHQVQVKLVLHEPGDAALGRVAAVLTAELAVDDEDRVAFLIVGDGIQGFGGFGRDEDLVRRDRHVRIDLESPLLAENFDQVPDDGAVAAPRVAESVEEGAAEVLMPGDGELAFGADRNVCREPVLDEGEGALDREVEKLAELDRLLGDVPQAVARGVGVGDHLLDRVEWSRYAEVRDLPSHDGGECGEVLEDVSDLAVVASQILLGLPAEALHELAQGCFGRDAFEGGG